MSFLRESKINTAFNIMANESKDPTPFEKFRAFTKKVVSVPKSEIDKREKEYKDQRQRKRDKKRSE